MNMSMKNRNRLILFLIIAAFIMLIGILSCQQKTYPAKYEYMASRQVPTWNVWVTSEEQIDSMGVEFVDPIQDSIGIIINEYYKYIKATSIMLKNLWDWVMWKTGIKR